MANNYTTMSLDALKYLCSVINSTVDLPNTVISDTSIATNTTYSSFKLDKEFDTLEDELKHYTDTAIAGLNKLTKEIINDKALVVKDNVLYLYKADDDPSNDYMQMMLINGVAVELGSTQVDMDDYYNKTDSDNKFAAKLDLDTLTTSFNDLKTVIGDTTQVKNNTLMEDVQELYTGLDVKVDKTDIATTISSTSTDTQVPSAKAVYDFGDNFQPKSKVADVPKTNLTSLTSYYVEETGNCKYIVKNGVCYVSLSIRCIKPSSTGEKIFKLPPSVIDIKNSSVPFVSNQLNTLSGLHYIMDNTGVMSVAFGTAGYNYFISFSYPVAES